MNDLVWQPERGSGPQHSVYIGAAHLGQLGPKFCIHKLKIIFSALPTLQGYFEDVVRTWIQILWILGEEDGKEENNSIY